MRFLMLNWRDPKNPQSGGAERVTQAYLEALAARGHEVFWFSNHFPGALEAEKLGPMQIVRGGGKGTSILAAWRWYRARDVFHQLGHVCRCQNISAIIVSNGNLRNLTGK